MIWSSGLVRMVPSTSCFTKKLFPDPVLPQMKPTGEARALRLTMTRLLLFAFWPA